MSLARVRQSFNSNDESSILLKRDRKKKKGEEGVQIGEEARYGSLLV